jgi:hypothetical protein
MTVFLSFQHSLKTENHPTKKKRSCVNIQRKAYIWYGCHGNYKHFPNFFHHFKKYRRIFVFAYAIDKNFFNSNLETLFQLVTHIAWNVKCQREFEVTVSDEIQKIGTSFFKMTILFFVFIMWFYRQQIYCGILCYLQYF